MASTQIDFSSSSSSESDDDNRRLGFEEVNQAIDQLPRILPQILPSRSRRGTRREVYNRNHEAGYNRLFSDYFAENAVYPDHILRRRFRMRKHVFLRIVHALEASDVFFQRRPDAIGRLSISALQKCTAAIRMLAYGTSADAVDEYIRLGEGTARTSLLKFTEGVNAQFGSEYLRRPTTTDLTRLLQIGQHRGFPGMVGSIDCMHWEWKNCPAAWKAQYQGRSGKATLVLEAVASQDLWIWHSFFGIPGSCNDLNVLHRSPVFNDIFEGRAPHISYVVNGHQYDMGYYLTDGIYPQWAAFIQSVTLPQTRKDRLFAQHQEAARKDVERAFGVLQSRFAIIRKPSLAWDTDILNKIMMACIIMHNMIVEDERDSYAHYADIREFSEDRPQNTSTRRATNYEDEPFEYSSHRILDITAYLNNRDRVRDKSTHVALKKDLIENVWQQYGQNDN